MIPYFAALTVVAGDPTNQPVIEQAIPEALGEDPKKDKRALWAVPISVRLSTRPIRVEQEVKHEFLIYAGPAKVRLLRYETGVRPGLPEIYEHDYHLANLTDYPWYTFTGAIGWTALVVFFTNPHARAFGVVFLGIQLGAVAIWFRHSVTDGGRASFDVPHQPATGTQ
jgi:hypothetical protein